MDEPRSPGVPSQPAEVVAQSSRRMLGAIRRQWYVVVVAALGVGIVCLGVSLFQTPVYTASATVYVTSGLDARSQSAYQGSLASEQKVASYAELVTSDAVLSSALSDGAAGISIEQAREAVSAKSAPDTVLLDIWASSPDAVVAATLANRVAESLRDYVAALERPSSGGEPLAKVTVVSPALVPQSPATPRTARNSALGLLAGALVGSIFVLLRDRFDNRVSEEDELSSVVPEPVLSSIPADVGVRGTVLVDFGDGGSLTAEAFRRFRSSLSFLNVDAPARTILVTSANGSEGKTTNAVNLAASLAEAGSRVILVDADLRRPSVQKAFNVNSAIGLTQYLRGYAGFGELTQSSGRANLDLLMAGELPPNPAELLGSKQFAELLDELSGEYDYVIVDSPPVLPVTDASVIGQCVDGVVLVVRAGVSRSPAVLKAHQILCNAHVGVLGTVLNGTSAKSYGYGYGYAAHDPVRNRPTIAG